MIAALQRLKAQYEPELLPEKVAAMGISGKTRGKLGQLFATHPSLDDRIEALRNAR
jgi:heat shock protein HtpX